MTMSSAVAAHAETASSHRSSTAMHTPITASDDALHSEEKRSPISSKANVITTEEGMVAEKAQDRDIESSSYKSQVKGAERFHRLSWFNLSCVLIVEAIALGALSLAKAYSTIGMVPGVLLTVFLGLVFTYTSELVGQACLKSPTPVNHYADLGGQLFGRWGREIVGVLFCLQLTLVTGSHVITGSVALSDISNNAVCSVVFGVVSAVVLFILALPPSFTELAILGYVDFVSIVAAILITMIATGIQSNGGMSSDWHAFPVNYPTFAEALNATLSIVFAFSFAICQPSMQRELRVPTDYRKAIWALGLTEIVIYTLAGAIIYAFVGDSVASPALSSAGALVSKVAYGVALPVIYISGSINQTTAARYIHERIYAGTRHEFISTKRGVSAWVLINLGLTILAFVIAEAVPFFSDLLSLTSSLFITFFSLYAPALMYAILLQPRSKWFDTPLHALWSIANFLIFLTGIFLLGAGAYASIDSIKLNYATGSVSRPYSCATR